MIWLMVKSLWLAAVACAITSILGTLFSVRSEEFYLAFGAINGTFVYFGYTRPRLIALMEKQD